MPVVAVIAAIAVDIGPIGAIIGGTASSIMTLSAITAIGATLGAIGAVTGNKTLGLIGAGIGLVGGIGTLAFGSDALGSVGELFGSSVGGSIDSAATAAAVEANVNSAAAASDAAGAGAATNAATAGTDITTATGALDQAALTPTGVINSTLAPTEGSAAAIAGQGGNGVLGEALAPGAVSGVGSAARDITLSGAATNLSGDAASWGKSGGFWGWAKDNQLLSYGVLQAGGSFISGLTNPLSPAQINALNAQASANNAAAALANRETENMKGGVPVASVTGKVAPGGIINNSAVKTPLITGTPNIAPNIAAGPAVTGVPA